MNLFRLFLLATGVAVFLIVRFAASFDAKSTDREVSPPLTPKTAPSESPGQSQPFPQAACESALVQATLPSSFVPVRVHG